MSHPIVLYDGVCGLCNRFVQYIIRRDDSAVFRFMSLQSAAAGPILARHNLNRNALETVYVVVNVESEDRNSADPNRNYSNREYLLSRSDAAIFILAALGGMSRRVTSLLRLMPEFLRDFGYRLLASQRYRMFGRYETCPLPSAEDRGRFLDPGD